MATQSECEVVLRDHQIRALVHTPIYSIDKMSDEELRQAIVQDVLDVVMMELKNENVKLHFSFSTLTCLLPLRSQRNRVKTQLNHKEVRDIIVIRDGQLRVKTDKLSLETAMHYCGVYYDGYSIPEGVKVFSLSAATKSAIEEFGLDNAVNLIASKLLFGDQTSEMKH